ncbi:tyrosine-type recombinase/integrase [bacterium]|nr:tyrosine-type recombinase/integrase [bacterium]
MTEEKLSPATVARRCSLARTFFRDALRRRLIACNPFEGVGGGPKNNPERSRFIDRSTIQTVIDSCPSVEWRCLVALSRFAGLRVPSEALTLQWQDIDWERDRMVIHSPKTAHHDGKATRVCPLFPELRPYLEELFDQAPDGAVFVLPSLRPVSADREDWKAINPRTQFERIIRRAGLTPWPRLWHNLRASRQTELVEEYPAHVVSAWIGNTERIAAKHYLQVLDSHFDKAARGTSEPARLDAHAETENEKTTVFAVDSECLIGPAGFEPATKGL